MGAAEVAAIASPEVHLLPGSPKFSREPDLLMPVERFSRLLQRTIDCAFDKSFAPPLVDVAEGVLLREAEAGKSLTASCLGPALTFLSFLCTGIDPWGDAEPEPETSLKLSFGACAVRCCCIGEL